MTRSKTTDTLDAGAAHVHAHAHSPGSIGEKVTRVTSTRTMLTFTRTIIDAREVHAAKTGVGVRRAMLVGAREVAALKLKPRQASAFRWMGAELAAAAAAAAAATAGVAVLAARESRAPPRLLRGGRGLPIQRRAANTTVAAVRRAAR